MTVDIATLQIRIDSSETQNATRNLEQMNDAGDRAETVTSNLADTARKLQSALAVLGIVKIVSEIIKMSDAYDQMTARLKIATSSTAQFLIVQKELIGLSERQRVSLESTTDLYAKASAATAEMGVSQKDIIKFTEGVSAALMINGSSAESASGALNQLGQALGGAKIQAEEYNSILDGARPLLQAVANNIGATGGSVAMLTTLVRAGKVDSAEFFAAAVKGADELIAAGKEIPITFSQAIGIAKDRLMVFVGGMNESTGVVTAMSDSIVAASKAIVFLSNHLDVLVSILGTLIAARVASWVDIFISKQYALVTATRAAAAATIVSAQADVAATAAARTLALARVVELEATVAATAGGSALAIATTSLTGAQVRAIAAEEAHVASLMALSVAQRAASVTAGALTGALALVGGPIGAIITALGIGATAWYMWGQSASEAARTAAGDMRESTPEILANIDRQNVKLRERIALALAGQTELSKTDSPAAQAAAETLVKLNALRERGATLTGVEQITVVDLTIIYEKLTAAMKETAGLKTELDQLNSKKTTSDWMVEYATNSEKLAAKLAEVGKSYKDGVIPPELRKRIEESFAAHDEGAKKAAEALKEATKSAVDFIAAMQIETSEIGKGEDQLRMMAAARAAAKAPTAALRMEIMQGALALDTETKAFAASEATKKSMADATQALTDSRAAEYAAIAGEVQANNEAILTYGLSKSAIEALTLARMEDRLARRGPQDLDLDEAEVNHLMRMIGLQKEKAATTTTLGVLDTGSSVAKAKELLDILTAVDAATKSAADGMAASFGRVGSAIGGLTTALSGYAVQQQAIAAQLAADKADPKNATKIADLEKAAARSSAQAKIKSYGDMASAAKGFFKENSTGYKVMETAEKAFRAYEMAMAVESMVKKIFFKETEVAANIALNTTKVGGEAAASAASTGLAATEASAWGITAVVKALASLPFPLNLAAGAATLAAVVASGAKMLGGTGGSSVSLSEQRQAANGTGSILGDSSAKSDSIAHSLAIMEKNSGLGLAHTISMDSSLKQMVAGIGNLGSLLARSGITTAGAGATAGIATGSTSTLGKGGQLALSGAATYGGAMLGGAVGSVLTMGTIGGTLTTMGAIAGPIGMAIGAAIGFVVSKLIKTSVSVKDSGITGAATSLGNVDALGFDAQAYADINVKKKAFGISYSSKNSTQTAALSDEMNDQFTMIITSMGDTIRSAADVLGLGGAAFNAHLNSFVVDLGKISLKDLTAEEQQKALETAFSKMGDDMAKFGVAGLEQYQAVGEGYLETLLRVTNDYMQVSDVLAVLNKSFNVTGLGAVALSESLITAAGGLEALTSGTSYFVENFLTEAERMAPITKSVNDAMGKLGVSGVTTVDQFKALVLAQDLSTAAGQAMYAQLIALAEPFKTAADYAADLAAATGDFAAVAKTASEIASEHRDLQQQLNELTKTEAQLLAIQRAGVADVNKALFDQVQAAKAVVTAKDAVAKAYETEATAAKTALGTMKTWLANVSGFNASLAMGNLSTLTPEQRYAEARAQFEKTLAAANAGDTTAQSGLSAAEQAFLTASQVVNASDAKYVADYARVMAANDEAMRWASTQVDVAQASLDALTAQVSGLITINDSVLTVAQAITNLQVAMGVSNGLGVEFTNAPAVAVQAAMTSAPVPVVFDATRYSAGSSASSEVLVAEVRALNARLDAQTAEIKGLRDDQKKHTGATIQATFESNAIAAKTVVAGVEKSAKQSVWTNESKAELA